MKKFEQVGDSAELANGSLFFKFTLTTDHNIVIEEYFGYDFKRSHIHSKESARAHWKQYIKEGYVLWTWKIGNEYWTHC